MTYTQKKQKIADEAFVACQEVIDHNQSNLNPKGKIEWISSGDKPFSSIKLNGVFTLEHLLKLGEILKTGRQKILAAAK